MRRKARVTFPKLVQEVLLQDKEYFHLKKETMCNLIVEGLGFVQYSTLGVELMDKNKSITFNLNEKNTKLLPEMLKIANISEGEFFRKIFILYANLHASLREKILFKDKFLRIEQAILHRKKIKIYHEDKLEEVEPIAFERNLEQGGYTSLRLHIHEREYLYDMKCIEYMSL